MDIEIIPFIRSVMQISLCTMNSFSPVILRPNVEGMFCDRCSENMYNLSAGCQPCPACYGLVQKRVHAHRKTLAELHILLKQASGENFSLNDSEFESLLDQVKMSVNQLHDNAQKITDDEGPSVNDIARLKVI